MKKSEDYTMRYVNINGTLKASQLALGCMRIGGKSEKEIDEIIFTALENGINYFDHADIYGGGSSERVFGKFLKRHPDMRDKMYIQTKCGIRPGMYDFSKEHIIKSVEGSLQRLGLDGVDTLLLHRPDTLMEPSEVAESFDMLKSSGKVKYFGVSNHNLWQIELLKTRVNVPLVINQLQFSIPEAGMVTSGMNVNMKNPESVMHDGGILEYSRIKNMTIQAWSPFQYGFFEGVFVGSDKFPTLNKKLDELAEKYNVTPSAVAMAWIMRHPAGIQVIAGTTNPTRIKELCHGADVVLTRDEWYDIYRAAGHTLP